MVAYIQGLGAGYSQHSYECKPLPTETLSSDEVLTFRDRAFAVYFTNSEYRDMVREKFGPETPDEMWKMVRQNLPRKYAS